MVNLEPYKDAYLKILEGYDLIPISLGKLYSRFTSPIDKLPPGRFYEPIRAIREVGGNMLNPDTFRYLSTGLASTSAKYALGVWVIESVQSIGMDIAPETALAVIGEQVLGFLAVTALMKPALLLATSPKIYWSGGEREGMFIRDQLKMVGGSGCIHIGSLVIPSIILSAMLYSGVDPKIAQLARTLSPVGIKIVAHSEMYTRWIINKE